MEMDQEMMDKGLDSENSRNGEEIVQTAGNLEKEEKTLYQLSRELDKQYEQLQRTIPMTVATYLEYMSNTSRIGEVNHDETKELVSAAKGDRSVRSFAEELGVSASTITRILNGQTSEISPNLISKIVGFADEDSGVTLEKMMAAQGLEKDNTRKPQRNKSESMCRMIIADELLQRGKSVRYSEESVESRRISDIQLITDAFGNEDSVWLLEFKSAINPRPGAGVFSGWLDRTMAYYYNGGKASRVSYVVEDQLVFKTIVDRLSRLCISDEISVILVSTKYGMVMDEYIAPLKDGRKPKFVFAKEKGEEE